MPDKIILSRSAFDDLDKLGVKEARRIVKKLQWLAGLEKPSAQARILSNSRSGDLRFRVGDYRMIGVVKEKSGTIIIVKIGHRREIYR